MYTAVSYTHLDVYKRQAEGIYTEKRSKFIAIAIPVRTIEEIKQHLDAYQKKYYDCLLYTSRCV